MLEQELKNIWRNSSKTEQIKFNVSQLLIELNHKMKTIEKSIQKRDRREIGASLVGIPLHIYLFIEIPYPITRVGLLLIIGWFLFVIYKLRAAQKNSSYKDYSLSIKQQLEQQMLYLKKQANLLDTAFFWYVIPPFALNVLCIFGVLNPEDYNWSGWLADLLPYTTSDKWSTVALLFVFYTFIAYINHKASRRNIHPIMTDIEQVKQQLEFIHEDADSPKT